MHIVRRVWYTHNIYMYHASTNMLCRVAVAQWPSERVGG